MKHLFTDIDGAKYFLDARGDIVDHNGELVSLTCEANIRNLLNLH